MSPEMLLNKGISFSYDWYMLGCLLYGTPLGCLVSRALRGSSPVSRQHNDGDAAAHSHRQARV